MKSFHTRHPIFAGWQLVLLLVLLLAPDCGCPLAQPLLPADTAWESAHGSADPEALQATPEAALKLRQQLRQKLGIERWHQQGYRGQGVKVAILDSGFRNYRDFLGRVLPRKVTVRSFRRDEDLEARNSQHGILCAEAIHALAPEAELLLANWEPNQPAAFLQALHWARQQGASIVSCSLIMPSWSDGEGGGAVNRAITQLVGSGKQPGDVLFFASAGNTAQRHWCGTFHRDPHGYHQWEPGRTGNTLIPWEEERIAVELYGRSAGSYRLEVRDALTGECVGQSLLHCLGETAQEGSCALVRFLPRPQRRYLVKIQEISSADRAETEPFHLVVLGGSLMHTTSHGSIACPADGPGALAIGAVNAAGQRWDYSSCGPNSRWPKPDFVAPVPFPSLWRERPFSGTSAAAPQAAALAAVCWSKHADWTAEQVRQALRESALDLGPPGHDWETGYGMVMAPSP